MASTHLPESLSPDSVDTLTELGSILVKLRAAQEATTAAAAADAASSSILGPLGPLTTPAPAPGAVTGTTPLASGAPNATGAGAMLSAKELPAATDNLKHKLQRARAAVKTLPVVSRTLAQQQAEIEELEERRRQQLAMLATVKAVGLHFTLGEQSKGDYGERMVE